MKSLQLDKPHAIVMVGIPGSGKTYFAHKFAEMFNAPYIEQAALDRHALNSESSHELVRIMLHEVLKTKKSIVIEVNTDTRAARTDLTRDLKKAGYAPLFVWVQVDAETAQLRSVKQGILNPEDHERITKRFSPPQPNEHALVISGKHTYATQARIVLKKLTAPRAAAAPDRPPVPPRGQIIVR
ncbi:MAG TPA: AAA family ATPase [Candidatus Saccharibacteria bacterium]|nr:AAA family ATPase [Candidatus Saccharibacteria bacterium]HRK94261.1 AAA family ATPase [Candidatus Saccharibacteria bacterium]